MMDLKDNRDDSAILLITHDLAVIEETCDRVIVMYGGVIEEVASIFDLLKNQMSIINHLKKLILFFLKVVYLFYY